MKASRALKLANDVNSRKRVRRVDHLPELGLILKKIKTSASNGDLQLEIPVDELLNRNSICELEKLGYDLTYAQATPVSRPMWTISWKLRYT